MAAGLAQEADGEAISAAALVDLVTSEVLREWNGGSDALDHRPIPLAEKQQDLTGCPGDATVRIP